MLHQSSTDVLQTNMMEASKQQLTHEDEKKEEEKVAKA